MGEVSEKLCLPTHATWVLIKISRQLVIASFSSYQLTVYVLDTVLQEIVHTSKKHTIFQQLAIKSLYFASQSKSNKQVDVNVTTTR